MTKSNIMNQAVKWATVSNVANEALVSIITVILAGILRPAEFGVVAMAYIYIAFLQVIAGFGFNSALVQRRTLREAHLDSVFWVNVSAACILAVLGMSLSGWWSRATGMPTLQPIAIVLSLVLPVQAMSIVQVALLQRQMDFRALAVRSNTGTLAGGAVGIVLAVSGMGAWALVGQYLLRELVGVVLLWRLSAWRPRLALHIDAVRDLSAFSRRVLVGQIGTFFQSQTDSLLIGVLLGPAPLGLYRFADRLVEMILKFFPRAMHVVSLAHFAQLQDDLPALRRQFFVGSYLTSAFTFPALGFFVGAAPVLLRGVGPQWIDASMTLRILAVIGISKAIMVFVGPLLQALGRPGIVSFAVWMSTCGSAVAVGAAARLSWGANPSEQIAFVAAIRTLMFCGVLTPFLLYQSKKACGISLVRLWKVTRPAITTSVIVAITQLGLAASGVWAHVQHPYLALGWSGAAAIGTWLICIRLVDLEAWTYIAQWPVKARDYLSGVAFAFRP